MPTIRPRGKVSKGVRRSVTIARSGRLWVMTDRDRFGLRGSVKVCELHRTWYSRGCGPDTCETAERSDVTVLGFRPDGSLQRHRYKNPPPNSSEWTSLFEYNDANQLSSVRVEQGGTVTITRLYEYDSAGRISQLIMPDKYGKQRVAETHSYEAGDRQTKILHVDPLWGLRNNVCRGWNRCRLRCAWNDEHYVCLRRMQSPNRISFS